MADQIVQALACGGDVRVIAGITTDLVDHARRIHGALPLAATAFGELLTATALLSRTLKGEQRITFQIQANGPLGLMLTRGDHEGMLYGTVANPDAELPARADGLPDVAAGLGAGVMVVSRDSGVGSAEPWLGYVPLDHIDVSTLVRQYLVTSEQVRSAVRVGVRPGDGSRVVAAGGFVAQLVGGLSEDRVAELTARLAQMQNDTLRGDDLRDATALAMRVGGEGTRVVQTHDAAYRCPIGRDYYVGRVASLGAAAINDLFAHDAEIEITCDFTRETWRISRAEIDAAAPRRAN